MTEQGEIKTEFKYIRFFLVEIKRKKSVWRCLNRRSGGELGVVKWFSYWRQYCYFPTVEAIYSTECLDDISEFIKSLK